VRTAGVALVSLCVSLFWLAVTLGRDLEWVRSCPICHWALRRPYGDPQPHTCPNCGWVGY
jgi:hypothetical protein